MLKISIAAATLLALLSPQSAGAQVDQAKLLEHTKKVDIAGIHWGMGPNGVAAALSERGFEPVGHTEQTSFEDKVNEQVARLRGEPYSYRDQRIPLLLRAENGAERISIRFEPPLIRPSRNWRHLHRPIYRRSWYESGAGCHKAEI